MIGYGKRVLLVHDPQTMHLPLAALLEQEGFVVVQISNEIRALREMHSRRFDAVVTDYYLPGSTGLALLSQLHMIRPAIPVILFSEVNWDICATAELLGAFAWILKSSTSGVLLTILALAMKQNLERESALVLEEVMA